MRKIKVFISYSSRDREAAESIHGRLAAAGFDVWRDQTRLETDWSREIAYALAESDVLCLLWSEHSAGSKWVKHEWLTARALEKRIIPCLFPTAPSPPEPPYNLHGVSFSSLDEGSKQLIERVNGEAFLPVKYDYKVLPGNSYIPFNPNPFFIGRHADLLDLYLIKGDNLLSHSSAVSRSMSPFLYVLCPSRGIRKEFPAWISMCATRTGGGST